MALVEKCVGSLVGLAVCDAIGTTVEFMPPGSFPPVEGMTGGGRFNLEAGQWTDDTSMMLCLAESLIECQGFNPVDQCKRYLRWYQEGHLSSTGECFDIGMTVRTALNNFERSKQMEPFPGPTSSRAAGNGSLMRLAPVPIAYHSYPELAIELSGESSKVTHGAQAAVDTCKYFAGLIIGCLNGVSKDELLSNMYCPVSDYWARHEMIDEVAKVANGSYKLKDPPDIKGTGYVIDTLEAVLWAFKHTDNFKDGCLKAVNIGGDSDTVGAIYGQLAGAYYGIDSIPQEWLFSTSFADLIRLFAMELVDLSVKVNVENPIKWPEPCPTVQLSERYRIVKLQCYDLLEKRSQETIFRFSKPCPKQYKELRYFDDDVESIKQELLANLLSASLSEEIDKTLKEFEKIWSVYRKKLSLRLKQ